MECEEMEWTMDDDGLPRVGQDNKTSLMTAAPGGSSSGGGSVLKLSEAQWQEHQASGKFAGLKISYSMEGDLYYVSLDAEQYVIYQANCGK